MVEQEQEETEEEELDESTIFVPDIPDLSLIIATFRNALNDCLGREE